MASALAQLAAVASQKLEVASAEIDDLQEDLRRSVDRKKAGQILMESGVSGGSPHMGGKMASGQDVRGTFGRPKGEMAGMDFRVGGSATICCFKCGRCSFESGGAGAVAIAQAEVFGAGHVVEGQAVAGVWPYAG